MGDCRLFQSELLCERFDIHPFRFFAERTHKLVAAFVADYFEAFGAEFLFTADDPGWPFITLFLFYPHKLLIHR